MNENLYVILQKCKKRDKKSIEFFLNKFMPLINKYKRKLHYDDAKNDLFEKIIILLYKMPSFKKDQQIITYISISIKNEYIKLSKKNQLIKAEELISEEFKNHLSSFNSNLELKEALNRLTKRQKQIVLYKIYYNFNYIEIAKKLNISRQTLYKNKVQAFNILKKELVDSLK